MNIDKIGPIKGIDPTNESKKVNSISQEKDSVGKDSVHFSSEGKTQALYKKAIEIIKNTPDVRMEKIKEAKQLLESLKNPSDEVLEEVSKKILNDFGIA